MATKYRLNKENGAYIEYPTIEMCPEEFRAELIEIEYEEPPIDYIGLEVSKYEKRLEDGKRYFLEMMAEYRVAKASGVINQAQMDASYNALVEVSNELYKGQWFTAKQKLEVVGNSIIGANLYNRIMNKLTEYITANY